MSIVTSPLNPEQQDERYMERLPEIEAAFRAGYDEEVLEYHVWSHGLGVTDVLSDIRDELREQGVAEVPGTFMTHIDGKGHDYRYLKYFQLKARGDQTYSSAEALTQVEGGQVLRLAGIDEFTISEWEGHVAGTQLLKLCTGLGAYSLCAADMANTGLDYESVMKPDTEKLRREMGRIQGVEIDPFKFAIGSIGVVSGYHFVNLGFPNFLRQSPMMRKLHIGRAQNLGKLVQEAANQAGIVGEEELKTFLNGIGGYASRLWPFCKRSQ